MSSRFLAETAEQARAELSEALDGTAQSISRKLITQAADTEESSLGRTLETEARNTDSFTSALSGLDGSTAESASTVAGSAADGAAADVGGSTSAEAQGEAEALSGATDQEAAEQARLEGEDGATDDPIDLVTGEMFLPQADLLLPGVLPLALARRHASQYRHGRLFGPTWSSTLDQRIETDDDGIHFAAGDGRILHYPVPTVHGQAVLPSHGPRWPLTWDRGEDRIVIAQGDAGVSLVFPPGPVPHRHRPLGAAVDRAGNRITFVYDEEAVPTDVYHSGGYHVVVTTIDTRGGRRVDGLRLADPQGGPDLPIRGFRYDRAGRLVETYRPGCDVPLVYEYDEADRITRWVDRNGYEYRYRYRQDGRVVRAEGSEGFLDVGLEYDLEARTTTQTDAMGRVGVFHWNERRQTTKVVDALGNVTTTEKDRYGQILSSTDALGGTVRIERDEYGDPVRVERPDGTVVATAYDARRLPTSVAEADGARWEYGYDERGALTAVTDPAGAVTGYGRDERGALTSFTDPLGNTTTIVCDRAGLPVQATDPRGGVLRLRRDPFGRVVEITDPAGASTSLSWDVEGRLQARAFADGSTETWSYDGEGCLLAHTGPSGAVTSYVYGPFDVPVQRTDPDGRVYRFAYDRQLRLTEVAGPEGETWRYVYDAVGNLVAETGFDGSRREYTLDAGGRLVRQLNSAGQAVAYERDELGRVTTRTVGEAVYRHGYDPAGRLVRAEGPGTVLEYTYDPLGRVLSEALNGRALTNTYDAAGRRTSRTTPAGVVSRWSHDAAGDPLELVGSAGSIAFTFDEAGRETARVVGPAASLTKSYDALGRLAGQAVWALDGSDGAAGRQDGPSGAWRQVQARTYSYRADGMPLEIADRLHGTRSYTLDPSGRAVAVTGMNWREVYAYDGLGELSCAELPGEPAAAPDGGADPEPGSEPGRRIGRTTYERDAAGRIVRRTRRTLSGRRLVHTFTWDAEDRLVQAVDARGESWRYLYDPLGRRVAKTRDAEDGEPVASVYFTWDGPCLAEEIRTGPQGEVTALTWDYEPDSAMPAAQTRRSWAKDATAEEIDTEFHAIVADLVGTPLELVTPDGRIAWRASRTLWGYASPVPGCTADCPLRFPGQYHDPETDLHYNYQRYYEPGAAAYLTPDPLGLVPAPNDRAYVENPTAWSDPLGLAGSAYYNDPQISKQKQDQHVRGTPEYQQRVARGTPTSAFNSRAEAEAYTRHAWDNGTPVPGRPNVRDLEYGRPVGTGPRGGWQTRVRVHEDAKGLLHGHPAGMEH